MSAQRAAGLMFAFALAVAVLTSAMESASGAGFSVGHESTSGAGTSYSGGAAAALDATTIHANPAGMARLDDNQLIVGGHVIRPVIDYDDAGSVLFDGTRLMGDEGGNGGQVAAAPNIYLLWSQSDNLKLGVGVTAPYGLVTKYDPDWVGRYNEITTSLKTINVNPSMAIRLSEDLSIGGGFDIQYVRAKLLQAIDFGTICVQAIGAANCTAGFGLEAQADDGAGRVRGTDFGYGFNLGAIYEPFPGTRLGLHYRSRINYEIDLDASFSTPGGARAFFAAAGVPSAFTDTGAEVKLTIPETVSASLYHTIDSRWAVMADVTWTRWTKFRELRINFDDPATPTNLLLTRWNNVFRVSAGATYQWDDDLVLRTGFAWDDSPIDTEFRGPGIPDSDRYYAAVGFGYRLSDRFTIDAAYQHLFLHNGNTNRPSPTGSTLNGDFNIDIDVLTVGLTWHF